ncbi:MAG: YihY/virulence factor BrkB family protein [Ignavibacteria bacterium]|jgi:membrane protein|nr:YihY/virulence factor BrkB family protein [Ignavibacteria bacterium]MCU7499805.1 YihY/virulence factor BrkB family protein [Ignavibacteria bacterium]MCU7513300.1 YihY/virulence factor BrkB family protein [Ignavibacteria bacterium]MCU7522812.1 YihY/virulence factor BrkB family protein [Ignavibacteria bacterium]MCU7525762.1 YihY/virulence factor BrkB family protein [Ignavibacteria bacterium]
MLQSDLLERFKTLQKLRALPGLQKNHSFRKFVSHYFWGLYYRIDEHHVFLYSSGLAFSLFLCIVPFVLIIFSILGNILAVTSVEGQINTFIYTVIPYAEYAEYAKDVIFSRIKEVIEYKTMAGYIGGFGLFFAASGLFSSMRTILNKIFPGRDDKSAIIGKLRDFGMVLIVIVLVLFSTIILPAIDILKDYTHKFAVLRFLEMNAIQHMMISTVSFLAIYLTFYVFYSLIPYAKLGRRVPALSALWAAILWEVAKRLFGYYINHFATLNKIYGTYALLVVLAFWIYYSSITFLLGAEIGQLYRERLEVIRKKPKGQKGNLPKSNFPKNNLPKGTSREKSTKG